METNQDIARSNREIDNKLGEMLTLLEDKTGTVKTVAGTAKTDTTPGNRRAPQPTVSVSDVSCDRCGGRITQYPCKFCHYDPDKNALALPVGDDQVKCASCDRVQPSASVHCEICGKKLMPKARNNVPYWCGNCGHDGPYDGNCPACGSSVRRMRI